MRIKYLVMPIRLKKSKILYLFSVLVASSLLMGVYWVKSGNNTVDLHKVYAEQQEHVYFANVEIPEHRKLPQLNNIKYLDSQPNFAKNWHSSRTWNSNKRQLVSTKVKTNIEDQNDLLHAHDHAGKQFPVIRAQSNLVNDLGIDPDDLHALRKHTEANNQQDVYVDLSEEDIQHNPSVDWTKDHSILKRFQSHNHISVHQSTKVLHHYITSTARPLKSFIRSQTRLAQQHVTARPPLTFKPPQTTLKDHPPAARRQMEELFTQLSRYITDSHGQHLLQKLSEMKQLLRDVPKSVSAHDKPVDDQNQGFMKNRPPPASVNPLSDSNASQLRKKHVSENLIRIQKKPHRQEYLGMKALQEASLQDKHNDVLPKAFLKKKYYDQRQQQIYVKERDPVNGVDHYSWHQHDENGIQRSEQDLGHQFQQSMGINQLNVQDRANAIVGYQNVQPGEDIHLPVAPLPQHRSVDADIVTNSQTGNAWRYQPFGILRGDALNHYLHESGLHPVAGAPGRAIPLDRLTNQVVDKSSLYTILHAGKASQAEGDKHSKVHMLPNEIPQEAYIFEDKELPADHRLRPSIGNGHLATVIHNAHMFLSGFYNGYKEQSHRAEIPSTVSIQLNGIEPETNCSHKYQLNIAQGVFSELCSHKFFNLELRIYAHRTISTVMVVEVDLAMASYYPMTVKLRLDKWHVSGDITFNLQQLDDMKDVSLKAGHISAPETHGMPYDEVYILYDHIPSELQPPSGSSKVKWVFLTVVGASKNEVIQTYNKASTLIHSGDKLYRSHIEGWADLWKAGRIDVSGNLTIAKAVFSSMYHLLSSVPLKKDDFWPFVGLSPSGLPLGDFDHPQDYRGHVFCDQELWMFPPLLTFHPELANIVLTSRSRYAAKKAAAQLAEESGMRSSLKYPWQMAISGIELTEADDPYRQSVFTSGLISQAVLLYLRATNDTSVLMDQQYGEILTSIANYYYRLLQDSRAGSNSFGIAGVQAMDKYARSVNNSVFTNAVASIALSAPDKVYKLIGRTINLNYHHYANDIYIPYDESGSYHLEHANYVRGHPISQADVVLLGYPLMREMTSEIRKNDLEIYEKVLDTQAPPTSWSMYAIGWLEVGNIKRAIEDFNRQFPYLLGAFHIWTEKGTSLGASNYLSAAGSFLQSITNGFLGLRYHDAYLRINPVLPPEVEYMRFVGIKYLGASLEIWVWQTHMAIQVTHSKMQELKVFTNSPLFVKILIVGHPVSMARTEAQIMPSNAELPV